MLACMCASSDRMIRRLLAVVSLWHCCVLLADSNHTSSTDDGNTRPSLILQVRPGTQDLTWHSVNAILGHQMSATCCLALHHHNGSLRLSCLLRQPNVSLHLPCLESTTSNNSLPSDTCACKDSRCCYELQAVISLTTHERPSLADGSHPDSIYYYVFTVVCAGLLLLILIAAGLFLFQRWLKRQCLRKLYQVAVEEFEQPHYGNISDQFSSGISTVRKDDVQATTNRPDKSKPHCQNSQSNLSQCHVMTHLVNRSNWSATNSSMKESSVNDDHDDSSDGISFDDSGKDSGSLYIAPSHKTTSSEETHLKSKTPRYKRQKPPGITLQLPPAGIFSRKGHPQHGCGDVYTASTSAASRAKHRVHVTWKDSQEHIRNITEELNSRQRKLPSFNDDCNRYPFRQPMILSRNFASQQTLAFKAKLCQDFKRVDETASHVKLPYDNKHFYSESDLDDVCSESTTSLNRFSTVAYANRDVTRASVCSSSLDGAYGLNSMYKRNSMVCYLDTASYISSVSQKSHAV